ncbi:MAG TPA: DUF2993 domain-containing protein [Halomicronema sp.]
MNQEANGLHEQALSKAAEIGIASQLDEVEELQVEIKADPFKMMAGEIDSVVIEGEGLVMQESLRMEKLEMQVNSVAINPMQAAFGQIELTKPTQGNARVVLTESDINSAFNSTYISEMLQNLQINIEGKPVTVDVENVYFHLPGNNKVAINATVKLQETNETQQFSFTAVPRVPANGQGLILENIEYPEAKELSPELTKALLDKTTQILDFKNFDLDGISLQLNQVDVNNNHLNVKAQAYVEKIPTD